MNIQLYLVPIEEKAELSGLVNEYLKVHCEHQEIRTKPESVEDYIYFPEYWREVGRFPYFIKCEDEVAGFVLVRTVFEEPGDFYQVSDYYVKPKYQGTGLAWEAINLLWQKYPGRWELQVIRNNTRANSFWLKCFRYYATTEPVVAELEYEDGKRYQYNFESTGAT